MNRNSGERLEKVERSGPSRASFQGLHVLVVDDSLVDRKFIERLLKISFCKVTAVDSGRRALQILGLDEEKKSVDFDGLKVNLIITDYRMLRMTGYELLKKIKEPKETQVFSSNAFALSLLTQLRRPSLHYRSFLNYGCGSMC